MKILFFGDSICNAQYVTLHAGWVIQISRKLQGKAVVEMSAVNGRTTRQALEVMEFEVTHSQPDIMVVQFGMNDCNYWQTDKGLPRVGPKAFEGNMEEIIERAFAYGVRGVLVNTNHVTTRTIEKMGSTGITYQESNMQYNQIIRDVATSFWAKGESVELIDMEAGFVARGSVDPFLLEDGLHLSILGHSVYYEVAIRRIEEEIRRLT